MKKILMLFFLTNIVDFGYINSERNRIKVLKKMVLWMPITIFVILSILLFIMDVVQSVGEEKIISEKNIPKDIKVILVLGAGIENNGEICEMLMDRLKKAADLYKNIKDAKILLSGNHGKCNFDEAAAMKKYIMNISKDIKEDNIFLDHSGFSTYDSIYRAKNIYKVEEVIIVTNYYHLPRTLYIADKMKMEAFGIYSDTKDYINIDRYRERELLAQVKDFIYTNILKPKPKFLDEELPIDICNDKVTDNKIKNVKN